MLGRRAAANAAAVLAAGVFGDDLLAAWRTCRKCLAYGRRKARDVLLILFRPTFGLALMPRSPQVTSRRAMKTVISEVGELPS